MAAWYDQSTDRTGVIRHYIDQLQERLSSSQVMLHGLLVPLEMTFPHGGAEYPDEPQAAQPAQTAEPEFTGEDVRTKSAN